MRTRTAPPALVAPFSVPRIPGNPSRSPQINGQTRSELTEADNRANTARTHEWRSRPGGTGTQDDASRPVCRKTNSRRERRTKRDNRTALPSVNREQPPRQNALRCADQLRVSTTPDNRTNIARTHEWRSRPGGTGTQDDASRPVCRKTNSRRERGQNASTEPHGRREPSAKRPDRAAMTDARRTQTTPTEPHGRREPRQTAPTEPQ